MGPVRLPRRGLAARKDVDEPKKQGVSTLTLTSDFGRLWLKKPYCDANGLVSIIQYPRKPPSSLASCCIRVAAFSHAADILATVDDRGNVFAFHIRRNRYALLAHGAGYAGTAVTFSRRGLRNELYAACADHLVRAYDPETGTLLATLRGHRTCVRHLVASPSGEALLSASSEALQLWDLHTMERRRSLGAGPYGLVQAAFSPGGETVVAAFKDETFWFWDATTFALLRKLRVPAPGPGLLLATFVLSPDGRHLVAAGGGATLIVWDCPSAVCLHSVRLPAGASSVRALHWAPALGASIVAAVCGDGAIRFVDCLAGRLIAVLLSPGEGARCDAFALDPRGHHAAAVEEMGGVRLFDLAALAKSGGDRPGQHPTSLQVTSGEDVAANDAGEIDGGEGVVALSLPTAVAADGRGASPAAAPPALATEADLGRRDAAARRSVVTRLDSASARDLDMSRSRLKSLLDAYGEYPTKYRPLVWRFLLRLPGNSDAYSALVARGSHPALNDLTTRFPLQNRALLSRLSRQLSCLAHWSPVFGQAPWLPAFVFPFVKLFGGDELACFETVAAVLINWARGWLELFPHPPLQALSHVEQLVAHHDSGLSAALDSKHLRLQPGLWSLLSTAFSEVFSKAEWLKAWDHLLSSDPGLVAYLGAAYVIYFREPLAAVAHQRDVDLFLRSPNAMDANKLLRLAYGLRAATPSELQRPPPALEPLPPGGAYPMYTGYPKAAVECAEADRARLAAEEESLGRRRAIVADLAARTARLESEERAAATEHAALEELESQRRAAADAEAEALRSTRLSLDDRDKAERLKQIAVVEEAYKAALARRRTAWLAEVDRARAGSERSRADLAYAVRAAVEDESLKSLEFRAQQRLWAMEEEAAHAASVGVLRGEVEAQEATQALVAQRRQAAWDAEDEESRLRTAHEAARRARLAQADEAASAKQALRGVLLQRQLESDLAIAAVERERRLRAVAEAEAALAAGAVDAARQRDATEAASAQAARDAAAAADRTWYDGEAASRADRLAMETAAAAAEAAERGARLRALERAQASREVDAAITDRRREYERAARAEAAEAARVMDALAESRRRDAETAAAVGAAHESVIARMDHAAGVAAAQDAAEADERAKAARAREAARDRAAVAESESRRRHEETLAALAIERERQILALDVVWRERAGADEAASRAREAEATDRLRQQREATYAAREAALVDQMAAEVAAERGGGHRHIPPVEAHLRSRLVADPQGLAGTDYVTLGMGPRESARERRSTAAAAAERAEAAAMAATTVAPRPPPVVSPSPPPPPPPPRPWVPPPAQPSPSGGGHPTRPPPPGSNVELMVDAMATLVAEGGGFLRTPARPTAAATAVAAGGGGGDSSTSSGDAAPAVLRDPPSFDSVFGGGLDATLAVTPGFGRTPAAVGARGAASRGPPVPSPPRRTPDSVDSRGSTGSDDSLESRLARLEREAAIFVGRSV